MIRDDQYETMNHVKNMNQSSTHWRKTTTNKAGQKTKCFPQVLSLFIVILSVHTCDCIACFWLNSGAPESTPKWFAGA